ncbi:MAG: hypothetical protein WBA99_05185 [Nodosilinea sp.]
MKPSNSVSISSDYVLAPMAPEVAATFSPDQVQALQVALATHRHPVNIRLSLPLRITRVYLVLLADTEVRAATRRRQEAAQHPLWTPMNLLVRYFRGVLDPRFKSALEMAPARAINHSG